jgi:hypothetical protein
VGRVRPAVEMMELLAGGLEPVFGEPGVQVGDGRAGDAAVSLAPVVGVLGVAGPHVGDADATGEADAAVGDEDFAVSAVVEAAEVGPVARPEPADGGAGALELPDEARIHGSAADGIDEQAHAHPGLSARGQGGGQLGGDLPAPKDVGEKFDVMLGSSDGLEHGREDFVAVLK